jgi:outer membrane biosynthesis protein TonB
MRFPARSIALLLPLFLTACIHFPFHKSKQTLAPQVAPPVQEAPQPKPAPPAEPPPPATPTPAPAPAPDTSASKPEEKPKPPAAHRKPRKEPAQQAENTPPAPIGTPGAGAPGNPGVSAIGQLSSGESSGLSRKTSESIAATERGLNSLNRKLNDAEQKTAAHIREFLKQARVALAAGDVDGASTLAAKAKILLGELSQ